MVTTTKKLNIWPENWLDYRIKQAGMKSCKSFLEKFVTKNVTSNGLKLELEPTIRNHDEDSYHVGTINYNHFRKNL